jgi:hypothetical protein
MVHHPDVSSHTPPPVRSLYDTATVVAAFVVTIAVVALGVVVAHRTQSSVITAVVLSVDVRIELNLSALADVL